MMQTNPDLRGCCDHNHSTDPVSWCCDFLHNLFLFEVIQFSLDFVSQGKWHTTWTMVHLFDTGICYYGCITNMTQPLEDIFILTQNLISGKVTAFQDMSGLFRTHLQEPQLLSCLS